MARRLVLCSTLPMLPCYDCLMYVNFLSLVGIYLLHIDKNVQRTCVNTETMLRNVLNIASVPQDKEIVD